MSKKLGNDPTGKQSIIVETDLIKVDTEGVLDRLGDKTDMVTVPPVYGGESILAFLVTGYLHVHGQAFVYPDLADDVVLTAAAPAWGDGGAKIEVIPANALNVANFDLHFINIQDIDENAEIQIDIFKGASGSEVKIGGTRAARTTNQARKGPNPIQIPQQLVNERISCRLASSTTNATECRVSFEGHYYA